MQSIANAELKYLSLYINLGIWNSLEVFNDTKFTANKKSILDGLAYVHSSAHSWSFLRIFEAEPNLFDGYKKVDVALVI